MAALNGFETRFEIPQILISSRKRKKDVSLV